MMQPITINTQIISDLMATWSNPKSQREFHKFVENLEQFHQVYIDKNNTGSHWLREFRDIRNNVICDQNIRKLFDDLIGPRNIQYIPIRINQHKNYFYETTRQTPDKIGLSQRKETLNDIKFYDLPLFNSNEFNTQNFLFRIPKSIAISPGEELCDMRLFAPYVREANKIEFCDLFLFKNPLYEDDSEFLFSILSLCTKIKNIEIYCEPNELNILQKRVEIRLKKEFGKNIFNGYKKYNPPTKDVNHDRFIIIDHNKFSIRFTTSFNNFRKIGVNCFKVADAFLIEISKGRKYYD